MSQERPRYKTKHHVRVVTATSLFDGHDAAINIMRRILQSSGAEVIHLGHDRSVRAIVDAAIMEDAQAIAVSSYQGGHMEFFRYMLELLREKKAGDIKVFGGGGGVIVPEEKAELEALGVARIFRPEDGRNLGLEGMIDGLLETSDVATVGPLDSIDIEGLAPVDWSRIAKAITAIERDYEAAPESLARLRERLVVKAAGREVPVVGITGTGGAGKSSLSDELLQRFLHDQGGKTVAILSCDPTRRKTGGALLGDRIRMNALGGPRVFYRSIATRESGAEIAPFLPDAILLLKAAGFDLVVVETAGIGQGDAAIVPIVDIPLYVMTADFGAPTQLEKIDMLDYADLVAVNKFDRQGSEDALRNVRRQLARNRGDFASKPEAFPVYGTIASRWADDGVTSLYVGLIEAIRAKKNLDWKTGLVARADRQSSGRSVMIPPDRTTYLAEIARGLRAYHARAKGEAALARKIWQLKAALGELGGEAGRNGGESGYETAISPGLSAARNQLNARLTELEARLSPESKRLLEEWPELVEAYSKDEFVYRVRGKEVHTSIVTETLSELRLQRVFIPHYEDPGEIIRFRSRENLPGMFPFTAGSFPFKRRDEDPTRMFAGEGDAFRTNRRFKYLSSGYEATRLSTAFDSVTLYGRDPDPAPDIYGKVGTSGVSICSLDDLRELYAGFDLLAPNTSVSMTINGPAPAVLAMFLNVAIECGERNFAAREGRKPTEAERSALRAEALSTVRGTVQADILKEDQGQNTCIFSTPFALKVMGDIQEWFVANRVRNFYSVSISGYHIAEAGANPITQLAFTLANGFTYVEYYLARGMKIDDFAPNLSFFFSNGLEPEYAVIGRVARRIWAVAMRDRYGADERSQKLKYHIQTSGRSLHAQEIELNDIRTTLQALIAVYDNCNSLHTNSYDEAITTPTEESVRRALAIQLIINREWGLGKVDNPNQGAFVLEELTDLVEEAVLKEFERISSRGGVLGAMETGYQRGRIQDESMKYEHLKGSGEYPIIGVNTFTAPAGVAPSGPIELARATEDEKQSQLRRLAAFRQAHATEAPAALERLRKVAAEGGNVFAELMETVKVASLGQITETLFHAGGQYRRNM
ncbi:MAG TPA: fused isobutyryl-CoA mutase/GTPase IcmF [Rectinemataceae bacterium]|nr:fused isobutyryl-CoA mutase/GTPase IcmF [Rectinemataceae bacterium]